MFKSLGKFAINFSSKVGVHTKIPGQPSGKDLPTFVHDKVESVRGWLFITWLLDVYIYGIHVFHSE